MKELSTAAGEGCEGLTGWEQLVSSTDAAGASVEQHSCGGSMT